MRFFRNRCVSFKCAPPMYDAIEHIMSRHNIDRSSVIRLALFQFIGFMKQGRTSRYTAGEIVRSLERQYPHNGNYSDYCQ